MTKNYISLILKDLVILPTEEIKLEFNNRKTLNILDTSIKDLNSELIIITPKNTLEKSPSLSDLNDIGILVKIKKSLILPNGNIRVIFTGIEKVLIKNIALNNGFILCQTDNIKQTKYDIDIETTLLNKIKKLLKKYIESNSEISNSILSIVKDIKSIGKLVDMTAVGISLDR
jgi:ATP-dependent Lon protease